MAFSMKGLFGRKNDGAPQFPRVSSAAGEARSSSLATIWMVARGVPRACAAAAASPPSAASLCSRCSTSWVVARASSSFSASAATRQA